MPRVQSLCLILISSFALAFAGCATDSSPGEETGSLSLNLELADGITINEVTWTISGGEMMAPMSSTIDTSAPGATASVEVFGLPPGDDYVVLLEATDVSGEVTCKGDAGFSIEIGVTTDVMVFLNCKRPAQLGAVRVNGEFNICAELAKAIVSPLQTSVGYDIDLSAIGQDEEGDPITYVWTATGGSIADANAQDTTYTCEEAGQQSITIMVTDNDVHCRMATWTVPVTCVGGDDLCEEVTCDDTGNECTVAECNPANGECETSNVDDGTPCDGGAGACMSGECAPNDLCQGVDCDDGNECTADLCNPTDGSCSNDPVDDGTSCNGGSGMCVNGTCMDVDLCEGVTCDDTGNECTAAECNPDTGQCEVSDLDGNECTAGSGGGDIAINGGFETGAFNDGSPEASWQQFPGGGIQLITTDNPASGIYAANLNVPVRTQTDPAVDNVIKNANLAAGNLTPGQSITVTWDMRGSLAGAGGVVFVELFSELTGGGTSKAEIYTNAPLNPTADWQSFSWTTTLGPDVSGGVTLQLKAACGPVEGCGVDVYFDSVTIVIPGGGSEPGICDAGICVPNEVDLCEGNTCDDDDTECSDSSCDAGTGQCVATPINEGGDCEGGAGTCSAGVCEPSSQVVYEQDFNQLPIDGEFIGDGWLFFVNVAATVPYGYGGPAPNGPQICALVDDQGGPDQEPQQLSVYSDYNNADHGNGFLIETNVFQEPFGFNNRIPVSEVGKTYTFLFQAKAGNIGGSTTANAFIKVLNPDAGFAETAADRQDTTNLPADWGGYSVSLTIDASWVGQILQYGFTTNATNFEPSGNFYDNVVLTTE